MIVLTPGHQPTREIFANSLETRATLDQYTKFNHYGYYSTLAKTSVASTIT